MLSVSMLRDTPSQLPAPFTPSVNQNDSCFNRLGEVSKQRKATATVFLMQLQLNYRNCQQHGGKDGRPLLVVRCDSRWDARLFFSFLKWRSSPVPGSARLWQDVGQNRETRREKDQLLSRTMLVIIKSTLERMACGEPPLMLPWLPTFSRRSIKND